MITREILREKLDQLFRSREQVLATLNAHNGAIEVCQQLLKEDDAADRPQEGAESPSVPSP